MVDATVSFAIEKLGEFIAQEVNIRIGVKEEVRWLKEELGYLQSSVRRAELRQEDELIGKWLTNVGDVANDAVAILRNFSALQQEQAAPKQGVLDRFRGCVCMCKKEATLYDIGKDIVPLKERIAVIKNRRIDYGIDNILATPNVQQKQRTLLRTTAINNQVDVVGFEDDIRTLMAEINREDPSLRVISIHGMGGLGKTSLATKLHNSRELRHFDTCAKVCVSNEYDIKDVMKRIIKSFTGPEHEQYLSNMDEHDLLQYLPKLLQDRGSYFALIDDIWDIQVWEQIKIAFPNQENGSRIIITTRNKRVAETVDDKCFVHQLRFLREEESWQLFRKRVEPTAQNLEILGKEMVDKCRGLPLAIVVLSGLLLHNMSYKYWSEVKEHIWRHVKDGGSVHIEEILSLSYNDLSPQMRDCFLYLSRYPEDHIIRAEELKLLWIAEEFISEADEEEGVVMEDLAEDYLNELINRNLIQVEYLHLNGYVIFCRVHDLVRELAIKKVKEHKLLVSFDSSKHYPNLIHSLEEQSRHVIYSGIGEYLKLLEHGFDALYLRSLALVNNLSVEVELKEMKLMYTRFKNLKVLDMRSVESDRIQEEIGNLILLKFLGLMGGKKSSKVPIVIPSSINKLKSLQFLWGGYNSRYIVPRQMCELPELRDLRLEMSGSLNIGSHQTKLRTLFGMHFEQWIEFDPVNFTNLHTLSLFEGGGTLESIAKLTSLQTFVLLDYDNDIPAIKPLSSCNRLTNVTLCGTMRDTSELSFLPHSITYLSLVLSNFTEDPMPALGSLPNLTALELQYVYDGFKMVCSHDVFPSLQILKLVQFSNLRELQVDDGALPSLKRFHTFDCEELIIPVQLQSIWVDRW